MSKEKTKGGIWFKSYGKNVPEVIDFEEIDLIKSVKVEII